MKIILNSSVHPDWLNQGNLGVDLLFDDRTYQEMAKALKAVKEAKNGLNVFFSRTNLQDSLKIVQGLT